MYTYVSILPKFSGVLAAGIGITMYHIFGVQLCWMWNAWFVNKKIDLNKRRASPQSGFLSLFQKVLEKATFWDGLNRIAAAVTGWWWRSNADFQDPYPKDSSLVWSGAFGIKTSMTLGITWTLSTPSHGNLKWNVNGAEWSRLRFWDVILLEYLLHIVAQCWRTWKLSDFVWSCSTGLFWTKKQRNNDQHLTGPGSQKLEALLWY